MSLKKIFIGFLGSFVFLFGGVAALYLFCIKIDFLELGSTIFTGIAALATSFAAIEASRSATIAKNATNSWRKQVNLELEIKEAKELVVALNAWYRFLFTEVLKYQGKEYSSVRIGIDTSRQTGKNSEIRRLNDFCIKSNQLWVDLETAYDRQGFMKEVKREALRKTYTIYKNEIKKIMHYLEYGGGHHDKYFLECIPVVYRVSDFSVKNEETNFVLTEEFKGTRFSIPDCIEEIRNDEIKILEDHITGLKHSLE